MSHASFYRWLKWTIGVPVALSAILAWITPISPRENDERDYHQLATSLSRSGTFSDNGLSPSLSRPPLYPAVLSLILSIDSGSPLILVLLQAIALGLCGWMIGDLVYRNSRSVLRGFCAALACGLHPVLLAYARFTLSEILFTLLLTAGAWVWDRTKASQHPRMSAGVVGILMGASTLCRGIGLYFPFMLALAEFLRTRRWPSRSMWALLLSLLVIAPWAWRNYHLTQRWIPVSTGNGYTLWVGAQTGGYPVANRYISMIAPYDLRSPEGDQRGLALARQEYRRNGVQILKELPGRALHFWITSHSSVLGWTSSLGDYRKRGDWTAVGIKLVLFALQLALLAGFIGGVWRRGFTLETAWPIAAVVYTTLLVILTDYGPNRYAVPLYPLMIYMAFLPRSLPDAMAQYNR